MAKLKNISGEVRRFDLKGKTKVVEAGHTFQADINEYLEGAIALGYFEEVVEEAPAPEPPKKASETLKSRN